MENFVGKTRPLSARDQLITNVFMFFFMDTLTQNGRRKRDVNENYFDSDDFLLGVFIEYENVE